MQWQHVLKKTGCFLETDISDVTLFIYFWITSHLFNVLDLVRPWSTIGRRNCEASLRWWFQWFLYQRHLRNILVRSWAGPTVENKHAIQGWWRIYSAEYSLTRGKKCFPLVHWQCLKHGEDEPSYRTFDGNLFCRDIPDKSKGQLQGGGFLTNVVGTSS